MQPLLSLSTNLLIVDQKNISFKIHLIAVVELWTEKGEFAILTVDVQI